MSPNKLNREELIEILKSVFEMPEFDDEENLKIIRLFLNSVPDPHAIRFLADPKYDDYTYEQIVDEALSYKPIQLPASSS